MNVEVVPPASASMEFGPNLGVIGLAAGLALLVCVGLYVAASGQTPAQFAAGIILGVRGLVAKELRSRSRGWRPMWLLTGYLAGLSLAVTGFLALVVEAVGTIPPMIGTYLFSTLALGLVLLLAFITPALTVAAVSGERERRTLDLLLVTRASALGLVGGKLLGSLVAILFLLVASLPAFALVYLFGGVPPLYLGMVLAVAAVTALSHAALGLLLSALLRRTLVASVVSYLVVLALVFGLPFVSAIAAGAGLDERMERVAVARAMPVPAHPAAIPPGVVYASPARVGPGMQASDRPPVYAFASPILSLASVLPTAGVPIGAVGGLPLLGDLLRLSLGGGPDGSSIILPAGPDLARSVYVVGRDPATGEVETAVSWAPWVYHFLFSGAFTLFALFLAALALAPVKPWRRWRLALGRRRVPALSPN